jgi:hypothetical protein
MFWLVRDARVTSTHALKGQLVQGVEVPSDASVTLGPALKSDQNFTAHVGGASASTRAISQLSLNVRDPRKSGGQKAKAH